MNLEDVVVGYRNPEWEDGMMGVIVVSIMSDNFGQALGFTVEEVQGLQYTVVGVEVPAAQRPVEN